MYTPKIDMSKKVNENFCRGEIYTPETIPDETSTPAFNKAEMSEPLINQKQNTCSKISQNDRKTEFCISLEYLHQLAILQAAVSLKHVASVLCFVA
jgi:hypothetical protein